MMNPLELPVIDLAAAEDIHEIMRIFDTAVTFMRQNGNLNQWSGTDSITREEILEAISAGVFYVIRFSGHPCGCFKLIEGEDPSYGFIEGVGWLSDGPYVTLHRVASDGSTSGIVRCCTDFALPRTGHVRIDTHEDNIPMQRALERLGYSYRGTIYLKNGDPRRAYELIRM